MSTSIRICSYLLLPLIYLLVNVKIAQLGESFPITIVTFLPVLLLLFLERISVKKIDDCLRDWRGTHGVLTICLVSRWMPVNTSLQLCCLSIL
ncbi:colanic acid biosynthesis protein [Escherichia coli]|nr:colanic acid biosynthesis protein [Escherichia coli]